MTKFRNVIRLVFLQLQHFYLRKIYGMSISKTARISLGAKLDKTNPSGIYIGDWSYIASGSLILSHDYCRGLYTETRIGKNCFVGADVKILPGVVIGDNCIVGIGSVVTKPVPDGSMVVGNPAKIIKSNLVLGKFGKQLMDS